ncbi:MAG: hypothetical protein A2Z16_00510 [Chloroflexi bacterium RBG_16_54_18]|nr:MAG: hypothetical protein A2Z16_00510 [Chloroflexi bacterium RBG_16_54_18]
MTGMNTSTLQDTRLITDLPQLKQTAEELVRQEIVGVDTESNSLYAYFERVCLIQFSTTEIDLLIDPLGMGDLSALKPVFGNPTIEKVFHAAEYDLICLKRDFDFEFANLFDTMAASRILGYEAVGLGSMLEAHFGIKVDKRQQRANWGQRPLPAELLNYASLDTHYLIQLRNILKEKLNERGLWLLAEEDFQRLAALQAIEGNGGGEERAVDPWRINGAHDLQPQQARVLMELCRYRDKIARQLDRPLFKVINDQTLMRIALETPRDLESLRRMPGMTPAQVRRHGMKLLEAVKFGLKADPIYPPRWPRPDEGYLQRVEALRQWRKTTAQRMGVQSDVVLPRDVMNDLAKLNPRDEMELCEVMSSVPWRRERFGGKILEAMGKK